MKLTVLSFVCAASIILGFGDKVFVRKSQDMQAITDPLYQQVKMYEGQQDAVKRAINDIDERTRLYQIDAELLRIQAGMITAGMNPEQTGAAGIGLRIKEPEEEKPAAPGYQKLFTSLSKAN